MSLDLYFRKKNHDLFPSFRYFHWRHLFFFYLKNSLRYIFNSRCPGRIVGKFTASVNDTGGHTHTVPESYINRSNTEVNDACGYLRHRCKQHCPFTSVQYSDFLYSVFFIHFYVPPFFSLHWLFLFFHMSGRSSCLLFYLSLALYILLCTSTSSVWVSLLGSLSALAYCMSLAPLHLSLCMLFLSFSISYLLFVCSFLLYNCSVSLWYMLFYLSLAFYLPLFCTCSVYLLSYYIFLFTYLLGFFFFFNYLLELKGAPTVFNFSICTWRRHLYLWHPERYLLKKYTTPFLLNSHIKISTRKFIHYSIRRLLREYMHTVNRQSGNW